MNTPNNRNARMQIRRAQDRGHADHGWLRSYHTFSFANYYDPAHMGFRALRVINDDTVDPGQGFGTHPHQDMEIISYVIDGALEHQDSMGNGSVIRAGNIQRISAGTGIAHSEFNPSADEPVHFLQIWVEPSRRGLTPSYEERDVSVIPSRNGLKLIGSPDGDDGSVVIHQDARLYFGDLTTETADHATATDRGVWIQVINGTLTVEGQTAEPGDGVRIEGVEKVRLAASTDARFMLFDLV